MSNLSNSRLDTAMFSRQTNYANDPHVALKTRYDWLAKHRLFMLVLFFVGVLLILMAERVGIAFSITQSYGYSYGWNSDKAHSIALTVRFLGALCFMTGLAEYIIIEVAQLP